MHFDDTHFMRLAMDEAYQAFDTGEVPVGAVVVSANKVIGRGRNRTEQLKDATAHAEMQALTAAAAYCGGKYLTHCRLYVTLEPCAMCAGALFLLKIDQLILAAKDPLRGFSLYQPALLHPRTAVHQGAFTEESTRLIQQFFKKRR